MNRLLRTVSIGTLVLSSYIILLQAYIVTNVLDHSVSFAYGTIALRVLPFVLIIVVITFEYFKKLSDLYRMLFLILIVGTEIVFSNMILEYDGTILMINAFALIMLFNGVVMASRNQSFGKNFELIAALFFLIVFVINLLGVKTDGSTYQFYDKLMIQSIFVVYASFSITIYTFLKIKKTNSI